jgi:hypothetical protein
MFSGQRSAVFCAVAGVAERLAVVYHKAKVDIFGEALDVMGVKGSTFPAPDAPISVTPIDSPSPLRELCCQPLSLPECSAPALPTRRLGADHVRRTASNRTEETPTSHGMKGLAAGLTRHLNRRTPDRPTSLTAELRFGCAVSAYQISLSADGANLVDPSVFHEIMILGWTRCVKRIYCEVLDWLVQRWEEFTGKKAERPANAGKRHGKRKRQASDTAPVQAGN